MRVDFNFPFEYKIIRTLPTIKYYLKKGAQVILITHLDKEGADMILKEKIDTKKHYFHLNLLARRLQKEFSSFCFVRGQIAAPTKDFFIQHPKKVILLDNLRLNSGEESCGTRFAKKLSQWGDVYINDAFAVSHRKHASIMALPELLPHRAGNLFNEEIKNLSKLFKPKHPFLLALGGLKYSTKEPFLENFTHRADAIFLGGAIANAFLEQRGLAVGRSRIAHKKIPHHILYHKKIILPEDAIVLRKGTRRAVLINSIEQKETIYDIGPKTISRLAILANSANTILWNGTLGLCEDGFIEGTKAFAKAVKKSNAFSVVGGGDTVAAIRQLKLEKNFDFISTGGGAMLEFLAKETLPGLKALQKK